jgi:hypothetical protein
VSWIVQGEEEWVRRIPRGLRAGSQHDLAMVVPRFGHVLPCQIVEENLFDDLVGMMYQLGLSG